MKPRTRLLAAVLVATALRASAQMEITCEWPTTEVLAHEEIPAVLTLVNQSADTLEAGADFRVQFSVSDDAGNRVAPRASPDIPLPAELLAGETVVFTADVQRAHAIDAPGAYAVFARLLHRDRVLATPRVFVTVVSGVEVGRLDGTAPDGSSRAFLLRTLNRDKKDRLFLRIDDPDRKLSYGILDLGRFINLRPPILRLDRAGRVHVLHMSAPNGFTHSVYASDGAFIAQTFHSGETRSIRLEPDADGSFVVVGAGITPPEEPIVPDAPMRRRL